MKREFVKQEEEEEEEAANSHLSTINQSMDSTGKEELLLVLQQHPSHDHLLEILHSTNESSITPSCHLCHRKISTTSEAYTCKEPCEIYFHKLCAEAPPKIDHIPLHPAHPLPLVHDRKHFKCDACAESFHPSGSSFWCHARCGSDKSGEFICCETCRVFYHRDCFQVSEIIRYPSHNPDHTLVLFPDTGNQQQCQSCSISLEDEIYYRCTSCEFFVHVGCASEVMAYCEAGTRAKIELSWHKHPLLLCHRTESTSNHCFYCEDESIGPTYMCEEKDCGFQLHKRCMEIESTITHPHHPYHHLNLREGNDDDVYRCNACFGVNNGSRFFYERCSVELDVKCAAHFPTHKHYLHEHKLQRFERIPHMDCNRCGKSNDSPLFRCVACNFNLHEECMELPQLMKNDKIHWHPLTLHKIFLEDDTGEYYCEHCEKKRDPRLGAYVCRYCKISMPRIYHIHCVLPELGKLYETRSSYAFKKLNERITDKEEEVRAIEERLKKEIQNLKEATRELDELMKQRTSILDGDS